MLLNCGVGEDSWESLGLQGNKNRQSTRKLVLNIHWKDWYWNWSSDTLATCAKNLLIGKDPDAGKDWRQEVKGTTEDEMVGWHDQLNGHEFEQAPRVGDGQGSLACCNPWGHKESGHDWTELSLTQAHLLSKSYVTQEILMTRRSENWRVYCCSFSVQETHCNRVAEV